MKPFLSTIVSSPRRCLCAWSCARCPCEETRGRPVLPSFYCSSLRSQCTVRATARMNVRLRCTCPRVHKTTTASPWSIGTARAAWRASQVRPPLVRPYPSRSRGLQLNQLHAIPLLRSQAVSVTPTCTISCPPQPLGPRWAKATTANAAPMTRPRLYAYCRTSVRRRLALMWRVRTRTAHGAHSSKARHARRTTWRTTGCSPHPISMWCIGASFSLSVVVSFTYTDQL